MSEKKKIADLEVGDIMYSLDYKDRVIDKVKIKRITKMYYPYSHCLISASNSGYPTAAYYESNKVGTSLFINEEDAEKALNLKVKKRYKTVEKKIEELVEYSDILTCFIEAEPKFTDEGNPRYFKDIQKGDTVYYASVGNLEVKEYKITKKDDMKGNFAPITFETSLEYVMLDEFYAYRNSVSSWDRRWYTSMNKAEIFLKKWARSKFRTVGNQITKLMKEYDKLEEFLILSGQVREPKATDDRMNVSEYEK